MSKSMSFDSVQADGETLIRVWNANPNLALDDVTREHFKAIMTGFVAARATVNSLRTELTAAVNAVNNQARQIDDICVRGRAGARAQFGQDSTQYDQLGGARKSERKPCKKKSGGGTPAA